MLRLTELAIFHKSHPLTDLEVTHLFLNFLCENLNFIRKRKVKNCGILQKALEAGQTLIFKTIQNTEPRKTQKHQNNKIYLSCQNGNFTE